MKPIRVYLCEDTPEGIFTAIYDAGKSGYGQKYIRVQARMPGEAEDMDLFSEYVTVQPEEEKVQKVLRTVRSRISERVYEDILYVVCSEAGDKANVIYHYIVYGFAMGAGVADALQIPWVQRVREMRRQLQNEVHHYLGFLRFQEIQHQPSILLAVFEPKGRILPMLMEHFADRLNQEHFIIYDKIHGEAGFYDPEKGWFIRALEEKEAQQLRQLEEQMEVYAELWQTFFDTIKISERENAALQQNNLPLRFREHMPEFQK